MVAPLRTRPISQRQPNWSAEWLHIAGAVAILISLSSAPFVQISLRVLHRPQDVSSWAYIFPYWGSALVALCVVSARIAQSDDRSFALWQLSPVLLFACWALLSVLWTQSPTRTPSEALLMSALLFSGVYLGGCLSFRAQIMSLFVALHILTIASLVQRWRWPEFAVESAGWKGVFGSRNTLGPCSTLAVLSVVAFWSVFKPRLITTAGLIVFGFLDLLLAFRAGSDTAWIALVCALGAVAAASATDWAARRGISGRLLLVSASVVAASAIVVLAAAGSKVSAKLGKGDTFSGRQEVWSYVIDAIRTRPIFGFGFASFWDSPANTQKLLDQTGYLYSAAHNTFLEVTLYLGLIGLVFLLVLVAKTLTSTWGALRPVFSAEAAWWIGLTTFALVENLTESMIAYHSVFWVLIVAGAYSSPVSRRWLGLHGHRPTDSGAPTDPALRN